MTDGDAILRAILDDPADDLPRLAYADWLEENGQMERAEFIRLQLELAPHESALRRPHPEQALCTDESAHWCPVCGDCRCPEPETSKCYPGCRLHARTSRHHSDESLKLYCADLRRRERDLLDRHGDGIAAGVAAAFGLRLRMVDYGYGGGAGLCGFVKWLWRRGFVAEIRCPLQAWLDHGPAVVRAHPVEVVEVTDKKPAVVAGAYGWLSGPGQDSPHRLPSWLVAPRAKDILWSSAPGDAGASESQAIAWLCGRLLAWAKAEKCWDCDGDGKWLIGMDRPCHACEGSGRRPDWRPDGAQTAAQTDATWTLSQKWK